MVPAPILIHILVHVRVQQSDWSLHMDYHRQHLCQIRVWAPGHCLAHLPLAGIHVLFQPLHCVELPAAAPQRQNDFPFGALSQNQLTPSCETPGVVVRLEDLWGHA